MVRHTHHHSRQPNVRPCIADAPSTAEHSAGVKQGSRYEKGRLAWFRRMADQTGTTPHLQICSPLTLTSQPRTSASSGDTAVAFPEGCDSPCDCRSWDRSSASDAFGFVAAQNVDGAGEPVPTAQVCRPRQLPTELCAPISDGSTSLYTLQRQSRSACGL